MPKFFFDIAEGMQTSRDDVGLEMRDLDEAKKEAVATLPDLIREVPREPVPWSVTSRVRTECGQVVFEATLSFQVRALS